MRVDIFNIVSPQLGQTGSERSERAWAQRFPRFADWALDSLKGAPDGRR